MRARAFTVLELLVVTALLVAIASIVVPSVIDRASRFEIADAAQRVAAAIEAARAEAITAAHPVRVIAIERSGRVWVEMRAVEPGQLGIVAAEAASGELDPLGESPRSQESDLEAPALWAERLADLPRGLAVTARLPAWFPAWGEAGLDDPAEPLPSDPWGSSSPEPITLALFLPDGSAVALGPRYLVRSADLASDSAAPERASFEAGDMPDAATGATTGPEAYVIEVLAATGFCRVDRYTLALAGDAEDDPTLGEDSVDPRGEAIVPDLEMRPVERGAAPMSESPTGPASRPSSRPIGGEPR